MGLTDATKIMHKPVTTKFVPSSKNSVADLFARLDPRMCHSTLYIERDLRFLSLQNHARYNQHAELVIISRQKGVNWVHECRPKERHVETDKPSQKALKSIDRSVRE